MDPKSAVDITQQGIQLALMVSLPLLCVTLFIGLAVSVFQAVTQVHEMTLTFVPKLLGAAVLLAFVGNWSLQKLVAFTVLCFEHASRVAG
jgi:flagellar biosynthetic protein FliQ